MSTLFSNFFKKFQKSSSAPQKRLQIPFFFVYKNKKHHKGCFLFFGPPEVLFAFFLLSTSPTAACSQSIFHQRSSLKTVHRTVFFTVGFKSLRFLCVTKKQKTPQLWCLLFFLAHPKGFEPPFSRIGICCVIQLRHGWI